MRAALLRITGHDTAVDVLRVEIRKEILLQSTAVIFWNNIHTGVWREATQTVLRMKVAHFM